MPPIMDQLKIIRAMKEAGNVKVTTTCYNILLIFLSRVKLCMSRPFLRESCVLSTIFLKIVTARNHWHISSVCQRFIPSEFGNEVDRVSPLPPYQACCDQKKIIRRATENSGIPYTFVVANTYGAYFVNYLLRPYDKESNKVTIYGTGEARCKFFSLIIL